MNKGTLKRRKVVLWNRAGFYLLFFSLLFLSLTAYRKSISGPGTLVIPTSHSGAVAARAITVRPPQTIAERDAYLSAIRLTRQSAPSSGQNNPNNTELEFSIPPKVTTPQAVTRPRDEYTLNKQGEEVLKNGKTLKVEGVRIQRPVADPMETDEAISVGVYDLQLNELTPDMTRNSMFLFSVREGQYFYSKRLSKDTLEVILNFPESQNVQLNDMRIIDKLTGFEVSRNAGKSIQNRQDDYSFSSSFHLLRPTPVTIEIDFAHGQIIEATIPFKKDAVYKDNDIAVRILAHARGTVHGTSTSHTSGMGGTSSYIIGDLSLPDREPRTCVFVAAIPTQDGSEYSFAIRNKDGSLSDIIKPYESGEIYHIYTKQHPEEIKELVIQKRQHLSKVKFELRELPGYPEANKDVTNNLDIVVPVYDLRYKWETETFLSNHLQIHFTPPNFHYHYNDGERRYTDITLKEIMKLHFDHSDISLEQMDWNRTTRTLNYNRMQNRGGLLQQYLSIFE